MNGTAEEVVIFYCIVPDLAQPATLEQKAVCLVCQANAIPTTTRPQALDCRPRRSVFDEQAGTVAVGVRPVRIKRHFAVDSPTDEMNLGAIAKDDGIGIDRLHTDIASKDRIRSRVPAVGDSEKSLRSINRGFGRKVAQHLLRVAEFAA
ncbi:hypothetical protein D9M70_464150 [compost metagenome]